MTRLDGAAPVLLLSGATSTGKSTLAAALQRLSAVPLVHIEADRCFPAVPRGLPVPPIVLFHRSAAVWARAGAGIVLDGSLPYGDHALRAACLREFDGCDLRLIAVECALPVLGEREAARPDREPGWGARQSRDINDGLRVDARVDTTARPAEACARSVLDRLGLGCRTEGSPA